MLMTHKIALDPNNSPEGVVVSRFSVSERNATRLSLSEVTMASRLRAVSDVDGVGSLFGHVA